MTLALSQNVINLMYVVAAVGLILGIKGLSHPATARRGNLIAAAGMIDRDRVHVRLACRSTRTG